MQVNFYDDLYDLCDYDDLLVGYPDTEEVVEITLDVVEFKDPQAIHVSNGDVKAWLPISKINILDFSGDTITAILPEWLAIEKGLV